MRRRSSRRNGKPASCEPCRKNKTRCDHTLPKCNRCYQRGIPDQCFYHPAPLTKPRPERDVDDPSLADGPSAKKRRSHANTEALGAEPTDCADAVPASTATSSAQAISFMDSIGSQTYKPGYLGPTSYAAILPREEVPIADYRHGSVDSDGTDHELAIQHTITKSTRMQMTCDILKGLRQFKVIERLVVEYCEMNNAGVVGAPLVMNALKAVGETVDEYNLTLNPPDPRLASTILSNTSRNFEIPSSIKAKDFHQLCTGSNIRLEMIGLVMALAARAIFFGLAPDTHRRTSRPHFTDEMTRASNACYELCTELTPVNDITIWLLYEVTLLTSLICGDSSPPVWRRLGDLATMIYALGMHREPKDNSIPLFILETRRRIYCAAYNLDKSISTFLGRPVRLCWRHTDLRMPLDLCDDDLAADQDIMERASQSLDANGWNTDIKYRRCSWIRMRCITSTFREEILDYAFAKPGDQSEARLLDISRRCKEAWEATPAHLHYRPSCWEDDTPPGICLMMVIVYLTYLYNEFLVQKILDRKPLTCNHPLLSVSKEMLTTVLSLGQPRDRNFDVHRDFSYTILLYGIPSGSILVTALQEQSRTGEAFPSSISRSEIIRTLSVLISHLESVARPGDGNYTLCRKAAKAFTRIIDSVLDSHPSTTTPTSLNLGLLNAPGFDGFDSADVMGLFDNMDWSSGGQWAF